LSKAESIAKGLKIKNDECVREIEKMGSEVRVMQEEMERTNEKTKTLESNRDALELVVKETQSELYSVKEETERRIRQLTMEQSTSEVHAELRRERESRAKESRRAERAERALDDAAVAFSGERRDADDEMRRHIERRLEVENEREKCLNALEEKERKWEKERRERDAKEGKLTRENEQLTSENEKRKDQIKSLEEECRKANAAVRERSADMALAVKKLNVELKQQRLETEKGMAKRVEALRVAFGNAIEDVKEEARASLSRKDEEIARVLAKESEANTRMASVEKHCLKVRDALLELANEKESLEEERDELRRALQRAGEMNAQLTKRAMDNASATGGGEGLAKQQQKRAAFTKIPSNVHRHHQYNKGPKQLAETLAKELEQLKSAHEESIEALTTSENGKDLEKMVERIDEISRKIAAKATQVSLALKSSS
jgi:chromosome segregation ATPase